MEVVRLYSVTVIQLCYMWWIVGHWEDSGKFFLFICALAFNLMCGVIGVRETAR